MYLKLWMSDYKHMHANEVSKCLNTHVYAEWLINYCNNSRNWLAINLLILYWQI